MGLTCRFPLLETCFRYRQEEGTFQLVLLAVGADRLSVVVVWRIGWEDITADLLCPLCQSAEYYGPGHTQASQALPVFNLFSFSPSPGGLPTDAVPSASTGTFFRFFLGPVLELSPFELEPEGNG